MSHQCAICGYGELKFPPRNHMICPSCGTQFGYDDVGHTAEELRHMWLMRGGRWFSRRSKPDHWDPIQQLRNIGYQASAEEVSAVLNAFDADCVTSGVAVAPSVAGTAMARL